MIENVVEFKRSQTEIPPEWGPGIQLQRAREQLRMNTADVARQLKLKLSFIDAIENDDYAKLPAATFVRGYLRAYARLVHLSGDEIIRVFNQFIETSKTISQTPAPASSKTYEKKTAHEKTLRIATIAIVSVLFILFFVGWYTEYSSPSHTDVHPLPQTALPSVKEVATPPPAAVQALPAATPAAAAPAPKQKPAAAEAETDTETAASEN